MWYCVDMGGPGGVDGSDYSTYRSKDYKKKSKGRRVQCKTKTYNYKIPKGVRDKITSSMI